MVKDRDWLNKMAGDEADFEEFALELNPEMLEVDDEETTTSHEALYATNQFY